MVRCSVIRKENFEISDIDFPKYVYPNESFEFSYTIKNLNWLFPGDFISYLYIDNYLGKTDNLWLGAGKEITIYSNMGISEPGIHEFSLNVLDDKLLKNECEDYKHFQVTVLNPGETKPILPKELYDYWYLFALGLLIIIYLMRR